MAPGVRQCPGMRGLWLVAALLAGCFSPRPQEGAPCTSSAQCPAGQVCNPNLRCELAAIDAGTEADGPSDAPADAPIDGCASCPVAVARYAFDGDLSDGAGDHAGAAVGSGLTYVPGVVGQAVRIPATGTTYVRVEDSPAFDVAAGALDLRFRFAAGAPARDLGLVSRDAVNSVTDGHFNLQIVHDRRVVARIQRMSDPTVQAYRCTAQPVAAGAWHHVKVSFGPAGLAMTVDGVLADGTTWTHQDGTVYDCTAAWDRGIAGNANPLILGAVTSTAVDGTGMPVSDVGNTVELDEVILWAAP